MLLYGVNSFPGVLVKFLLKQVSQATEESKYF